DGLLILNVVDNATAAVTINQNTLAGTDGQAINLIGNLRYPVAPHKKWKRPSTGHPVKRRNGF
ncbi:MAG: hypothetical protein AAF353_21040, partial [Pseudomonadota bacterium]